MTLLSWLWDSSLYICLHWHKPSGNHRYFVVVEFSEWCKISQNAELRHCQTDGRLVNTTKRLFANVHKGLPAYFHRAHGSVHRPPANTGFRVEGYNAGELASLWPHCVINCSTVKTVINMLCTQIKRVYKKIFPADISWFFYPTCNKPRCLPLNTNYSPNAITFLKLFAYY